MTRLSRRQFLTGATATAATIAVPGLASAATPPDWSPDHITSVGDDLAELRKYEPYLDIAWTDQRQLIGIYGWYADSEEHDTRAYYYWCKYSKQDSLSDSIPVFGPLLAADSHFQDHEPALVLADRDTGEVQTVLYSGYHHFAVELSGDEITLVQDETDQPTHPSLEVASPHHHYRHQRDETRGVPAHTISGAEFGSFLDKQSQWEQNGVFKSSNNTAIFDPYSVSELGTWWDKSTIDYQFARIRLLLNWRDQGHDELVGE
ncbi:twin-arginine translocation signal domain-containing protein [Natrinema versiforme]|uniref:Uncharacterized protein n=1 Tax=Natrinema versiforme JCM 10478 TaxID=1227496 RepID=L9Y450_9EURY|nr:twin-arginine translocation signal domain-containing protein [Natrinema versiforme]ELY68840.1 hypothetical protein C489_05723 [Natrinema versiforme JCM 10478]